MRLLLRIFLWLASVGWLLPAYLSVSWLLASLRRDPGINSFPYEAEAVKMFAVAFPWFATVVLAWTGSAVIAVTGNPPLTRHSAHSDA